MLRSVVAVRTLRRRRGYRPSPVDVLEARRLMSIDVPASFATAAEVAARGTSAPTVDATASGDWTVMVYITATDLAEQAVPNIVQMEKIAARFGPSVKIVVLYDQWLNPNHKVNRGPFPTGAGGQAPWTTVGFATIQGDPHTSGSTQITTSFDIRPEANTGDSATLSNFIVEAAQVAPANNYALILWDHGSGVLGFNFDHEDALPPDNLTPSELVQALGDARASGVQIDLLAFDACLMATAEVSDAIRDLTTVFVASQEVIPGAGYNYETALSVLADLPPASATVEDLARSMVASYEEEGRRDPARDDTLSAIRTESIAALTSSIAGFVAATRSAPSADWPQIRAAAGNAKEFSASGFRDLGQFLDGVIAKQAISQPIHAAAQAVRTTLEMVVFAQTRSRFEVSGVSIYLPRRPDPRYKELGQPFLANTGWNDFLVSLLRSGPIPNSIGDWAGDNNSPDRAVALGNAEGIGLRLPHLSLVPGRADWFRVGIGDVDRRGSIRLAGPARAALSLYSPQDITRPVARGRRAISLSDLPPDDYLLQVIPLSNRALNLRFYALNFNVRRPGDGPADRPRGNDGPDRTFDLGTVTSAGLVFALSRAVPRRSAWFQFETPRPSAPGERFSGIVMVLSSGQPLTGRLFLDDDDDLIPLSDAKSSGNLFLRYTAEGDSKLLIQISGAAGSYSIFFSDPRLRRSLRVGR